MRRILPFTAGGYTTVCEAALGAFGLQQTAAAFKNLLGNPGVNLRVVGLPWSVSGIAQTGSTEAFIEWVRKAGSESTDQFRIGAVKLYTDGSIVSRTSPIGWPGYWDGSPEGHMAVNPEEVRTLLIRCMPRALHRYSRQQPWAARWFSTPS
jgi:hypothetical protein